MGNQLDRFGGYQSDDSPERIVHDILTPTTSYQSKSSKKRKTDDSCLPSSPSKKKVSKLDTAKYVYEKLFLQGEGSDITIHAVGKCWNLHKLYLQQCKYFEALFNGSWRESNENTLCLQVIDENVTSEGMNAVFGSLYHNEIEIDIEKIEGVLAAATFLGLDSVISRCEETMIENLSQSTILPFHDVSEKYGLLQVQQLALHRLKSLFWKFLKNRNILNEISENVLKKLLVSSDLLVVEGELDLYRMVRTWIYLHEHPTEPEILNIEESKFEKAVTSFLQNSEPGYLFLKYSALFSSLRIHHFLTSTASLKLIQSDQLIPHEVISEISVDQWKILLKNEENPLLINSLTEDDFSMNALRLGRVIESFPKCWRWTGFNFGVDILLHITNYSLTMKRNCLNQSTPYSINLKSDRKIHYRLVISDNNSKCIFDSGKKEIALRPDQSIIVTRLPDNMVLPISVHFQYLAVEPPQPSFVYVNEYVRNNSFSEYPSEK